MNDNRELSMHRSNEFIVSLEKAGFDPNLAQKVIQTKDNRLAKILVGQIKDFSIPSITTARHIMGQNNFFGPDEWAQHVNYDFETVPEIPWTESELKDLLLNHFLFLGDAKFSPKDWKFQLPNIDTSLEIDEFESLEFHDFMKKTCDLRWYLMPIGIFPESKDKNIQEQVILLKHQYEIPTLSERFTANVLFYLLNGEYFDNGIWATTNSGFGANEYVCIRFKDEKLCLGSFWPGHEKDDETGIAALMRLPE